MDHLYVQINTKNLILLYPIFDKHPIHMRECKDSEIQDYFEEFLSRRPPPPPSPSPLNADSKLLSLPANIGLV
jgi:hypothetical protein